MRVVPIGSDNLFLKGGSPVTSESIHGIWSYRLNKLNLTPKPHFHDLRHTWKTNARLSGIDEDIRKAIMGHWDRSLSVSEGYGIIKDHELIAAIDKMTFDHGETEINGEVLAWPDGRSK